MSEGGRTGKPGTTSVQPAVSTEAPRKVFRSLSTGELGPARMNPVHEERAAANAQIQRSLKAWRAVGGSGVRSGRVPQGTGAPLPPSVRGKMEPKLGAGLGDVRIHTGGDSAAAAKDFGARAFTVGSDIHFNAGEFAPGSKEGDKLLAHELTHVVQAQRSGIQRKAENPSPDEEKASDTGGDADEGPEVSDPAEPAEKEADSVADQVADQLHDERDEQKDGKEGDNKKQKKERNRDDQKDTTKSGNEDGETGEKKQEEKEKVDGESGEQENEKAAAGDASMEAPTGKPAEISTKLIYAKIFGAWIDKASLAGPQKAPTSDPTHPHLTEMGITDMGPYRYFPMKGTFEYQVPSDPQKAWDDALATTNYQPEAPPKPQGGVTPADKTDRTGKAKAKIPNMDAILAVNGGVNPRAFTGVQQEDALGASSGSHVVQRHCINGASDMKTRDDVALRAAFGMIGGVVQGAYNTTASAFASIADADGSVGPSLNAHLTGQWNTLKFDLAAQKPIPNISGAGATGAVIFRSVDGAPLPADEVPKYLGFKPTDKGIRPLYAGDLRWQTWWNTNPQERKDYEAKNGAGKVPPPLTVDDSASASAVSMRVVATNATGAGGWVLNSCWPV